MQVVITYSRVDVFRLDVFRVSSSEEVGLATCWG